MPSDLFAVEKRLHMEARLREQEPVAPIQRLSSEGSETETVTPELFSADLPETRVLNAIDRATRRHPKTRQ